MNRLILGLMLAAGLSCMLACLGGKRRKSKRRRFKLRRRMIPDINSASTPWRKGGIDRKPSGSTRTPVEIKSMERVGSETGASQAAENFRETIRTAQISAFAATIKSIDEVFPGNRRMVGFWCAPGKDPNLPRYTVECVVHFNERQRVGMPFHADRQKTGLCHGHSRTRM